jgi:hypothetical protein
MAGIRHSRKVLGGKEERAMENAKRALAIVVLALPFLTACGATAPATVPPAPNATLVPPTAAQPTATAGIQMGAPVISGDWEITITDVHQESGVSCLTSTGASSSSAVAPYTYLVVDVTLRPLDGGDTAPASSNDATLLAEDGTVVNASGGGTDGNYCVNTTVTFETELAGFVFLVNEETLQGTLSFRFKDGPPIPLLVGGE